MTVITVQTHLTGVQLVAVWYRLHRLVSCIDHGRIGVIRERGNRGQCANANYRACDL